MSTTMKTGTGREEKRRRMVYTFTQYRQWQMHMQLRMFLGLGDGMDIIMRMSKKNASGGIDMNQMQQADFLDREFVESQTKDALLHSFSARDLSAILDVNRSSHTPEELQAAVTKETLVDLFFATPNA